MSLIDSYSILDTLPEQDFNNITAIASSICNTPISLITILDKERQWFKSHFGLDITETPIEYSFCAHAVKTPEEPFIIYDANKDERFANNPLVLGEPNIGFYAGIPLVSNDGNAFGTLCVIDSKPRRVLSSTELDSLKALARQVVNLLEARKMNRMLDLAYSELNLKNEALKNFTMAAVHDIKSPLNNITTLISLIKLTDGPNLSNEVVEILDLISGSVDGLRKYIQCLKESADLKFGEFTGKELVFFDNIVDEAINISGILITKPIINKSYSEGWNFRVNKQMLIQVLLNLITNAHKYNDKEKLSLTIEGSHNESGYCIYISDNGPGIQGSDVERLFHPFENLDKVDKFGHKGTGMGLSMVANLLMAYRGKIFIDKSYTDGAKFGICIPFE
jgi:K+-sensing histidine kinase KdpD